MRTRTLRTIAVALGLSVCTITQAQVNYSAPAQWDNFYPVSDKKAAAADVNEMELPAPIPEAPTTPQVPTPMVDPLMGGEPIGAGCNDCQTSPYQEAVCAPWAGAGRLPMKRWFGGASLLFMTVTEGHGDAIASGLGNDFTTSRVDPEVTTGFDVSLGRYFGCGRWGAGVTYFFLNPQKEGITKFGTVGNIRAANGAYSQIRLFAGALGDDTVENHIANNAAGMYIKRNVAFQGIEANLFCFGLMGARRIAYAGCGNGSLCGGNFGHRLAHGHGFGGATGPLVRAAGGRLRVVTSHGFRWFQAKDFVERGFDVDGTLGFQSEDIYEKVEVENNLYGYQFGGRLIYCLGCRWNLSIGGKFGLYGNHVEMRHCLGTRSTLAYQATNPANGVCNKNRAEATDTVLSTLGELDLGLGFRICNAWSIRGGYRLMGMTGVANAIDSHPTSYVSMVDAGRVKADDNYVLQGGYIGLDFNW